MKLKLFFGKEFPSAGLWNQSDNLSDQAGYPTSSLSWMFMLVWFFQ